MVFSLASDENEMQVTAPVTSPRDHGSDLLNALQPARWSASEAGILSRSASREKVPGAGSRIRWRQNCSGTFSAFVCRRLSGIVHFARLSLAGFNGWSRLSRAQRVCVAVLTTRASPCVQQACPTYGAS